MDLKYNTAGDPRAEIEDVEIMADVEWRTVVALKVRLHNPDGNDVLARHRFYAVPRFGGSPDDPGKIKIRYRLPGSPRRGDKLGSVEQTWTPDANPTDADALVEEAKEHATANPAEVLDDLRV